MAAWVAEMQAAGKPVLVLLPTFAGRALVAGCAAAADHLAIGGAPGAAGDHRRR